MGFLGDLVGVPGVSHRPIPSPRPPGASALGLSSFEPGPSIFVPGIPRAVSRPVVDPATCRRVRIPGGKRGTDATLAVMRELALEAAQDPGFVQVARSLARECPSRVDVGRLDWELCQGAAVWRHVREVVPYLNDPGFLEWVSSPGWAYFVEGREDCDGASTLVAAFDVALGRPCRLAAYKLEPSNPDEYSHVLTEMGVRDPGDPDRVLWLGQDTVAGDEFGWSPPSELWQGEPNYLVLLAP